MGTAFTNQDFVSEFQDYFGEMPDEDAAIPFAVCQGIEQSMIGAGSTDNDAMATWLKARTKEDPVRTILGRFAWDSRGLPVGKPFLMAQWNNGELQFIYPTDEFAGVAPMTYPKQASEFGISTCPLPPRGAGAQAAWRRGRKCLKSSGSTNTLVA